MRYEITAIMSSKLIGTYHSDFGNQLWSLAKLTKKHKGDPCALCGRSVGDVAFRPITNLGNRSVRICQRHMGES